MRLSFALSLFLVLGSLVGNLSIDVPFSRGALILTIAGPRKISEYFEWSCRSIFSSQEHFDLLVMHEHNEKIVNNEVKCATNVHFIDLGENGLSKAIIGALGNNSLSADNTKELQDHLEYLLLYIPQYLSEIKPMYGKLFSKYLTSYSHWGYTDADMLWGNIMKYVNVKDFERYDMITLAKYNDASRLYLRGAVCILFITISGIWY